MKKRDYLNEESYVKRNEDTMKIQSRFFTFDNKTSYEY